MNERLIEDLNALAQWWYDHGEAMLAASGGHHTDLSRDRNMARVGAMDSCRHQLLAILEKHGWRSEAQARYRRGMQPSDPWPPMCNDTTGHHFEPWPVMHCKCGDQQR